MNPIIRKQKRTLNVRDLYTREKDKPPSQGQAKSCISSSLSTTIPRHIKYLSEVRQRGIYFNLGNGWVAVTDCDEKGCLLKSVRILQLHCIGAHSDSQTPTFLYACDCDKDLSEQIGLLSINTDEAVIPEVNECVHVKLVNKLFPIEEIKTQLLLSNEDDSDDDTFETVQQLSADPLFVAVYCNNSYGIVTACRSSNALKCLSCKSKVTHCCHVSAYSQWMFENGIDHMQTRVPQDFSAISFNKIPYPLTDVLKETFLAYEVGGLNFPMQLVPPCPSENVTCEHQNRYDERNPVKHGWIVNDNAVIHKKTAKLSNVSVYFRPSVGNCDCRLEYDGQNELLLNLDNKRLFYYGWLFDILHDTQETRYPIAAGHRSSARTRDMCGDGEKTYINHLRVAYNAFIRLLDIDYSQSFTCDACGPNVDVVIMDGIMMGCRKDLMPVFPKDDETGKPVLDGSSLSERVLVQNTRARTLLAKYAGLEKGKYKKSFPQLSETEYRELKKVVRIESMEKLIRKNRTCPSSVRKLIGELSRGSPTCGVFQIASKPDLLTLLENVVKNRSLKEGRDNIALIQRYCPILNDVFIKQVADETVVCCVLSDIIDSIKAPFSHALPNEDAYSSPSPAHSQLEFFPHLPCKRGSANYKDDTTNADTHTGCRKDSQHHSRLSPGLFTMFCPHGVCLGFQVMKSAESPQTAFDILVRRFEILPSLVIYDNACKLHLYALKREPARFKHTRFMVDRLHYKGHVACSLGYSMDTYAKDQCIVSINSQTNEQANASLRRLATQLTYMHVANVIQHTAVFLAIRNMDKKTILQGVPAN